VTRETRTRFQVPDDLSGNQHVAIQMTLTAGPGRQATLSSATSLTVVPLLNEAFVFPNPARSVDSAQLWLRGLTVSAEMKCRVIDALGNELGSFSGRVDRPGRVSIRQLVGSTDLPSGIYLLQLEVRTYGSTGPPLLDETISFALTR
jgi:hypothetical protein